MISVRFRDLWMIATCCPSRSSLLLALLSGALLPIQASFNAQLARSLDSVPLAADISYLVGTVMLVTILLTGWLGHPEWSAFGKIPYWSLMGGMLGAWYIASSAYLISMLGTTLTLGLVVGGQAIAGMMTDHFGWLDVSRRRLTCPRRFALGLLMVALILLAQSR